MGVRGGGGGGWGWGGGMGLQVSHLAKNAKIKPKFHPFPSVNCFKTLHISSISAKQAQYPFFLKFY